MRRQSICLRVVSFALVITWVALPCPIFGQFLFEESFTGTSAPGWEFTSDVNGTAPGPRLTAGRAPEATDPETGSTIDAVGDGWLRLATTTGFQANAVALDTPIPSSANQIEISVDFTMWGGGSDPADGITLFLWDAGVEFDVGAFGGSLGYAQLLSNPGLAGAYLGVGLDVYGNFINDAEGRSGAYDLNNPTGSSVDISNGLNKNQVVVRGPAAIDGWTGTAGEDAYLLLGATGDRDYTDTDELVIPDLAPSLSFDTSTRPDQDAGDYRNVRILLDVNNQLSVYLTDGFGTSEDFLFDVDLSATGFTRPDQLRIGFGAATGGSINVHEIRNLSVSATAGDSAVFWDNDSLDNRWTTATNWDGDAIPDDYDSVLFTNNYTNTQTAQTISVDGSDKTHNALIFSGPTSYTLNGDTGTRKINLQFDADTSDNDKAYISVLNNPAGNADHTINVDIDVKDQAVIQNLVDQTLTIGGDIIGNAENIEFRNTGTTVVSGIISGSGSLSKTEIGTTRFTRANTFTGAVDIEGGILQIEDAQGLGTTAGGTTVQDGGTLALANGITVGTGETLTIAGAGQDGVGALSNTSGDNTWQSGVTLTGDATISSQADRLTVDTGGINGGGFNLALDSQSGANLDIDSVISNSLSVTKTGAGTATLSNNNTYSGVTTVSEGTLSISNAGALGNTTGGTVVESGATIELSGGINTGDDEAFTVSGSGVAGKAAVWSASGTNEIDAGADVGASGASFGAASGAVLSIDGAITGTGNVTITGDGIVEWQDPMAYTGDTIVESGTLRYAGGNNRLNDQSAVIINSGATLDMNIRSDTFTSLAGGGNLTMENAGNTNVTLSVGSDNTNTVFSGTMNGDSGDIFNKNGTGTMTFSGANTFEGVMNINAGEVAIGADNTFSDNMSITLGDGTLSTNGFGDTIGSLDINNTGSGVIDFNSTTGGLLTFSDIDLTAGSLTIDDWVGTPDATITTASTTTGFFVDDSVTQGVRDTIRDNTTFTGWGDVEWRLTGDGRYELVPTLADFSEWDADSNSAWGDSASQLTNWDPNAGSMPGLNVGDKVIFGNLDANAGSVNVNGDNGGTRTLGNLTFNQTTGNNYVIRSSSNSVSRTFVFDQTGDADAFIIVSGNAQNRVGNNNRNINFSLNDNLQIINNSSATTGLILGGTSSTLATNGNNITVSGSSQTQIRSLISGGGAIVKNGDGILRLDDANTFTGGVTLNEGTLRIRNNAALGTGDLTINGGTLNADNASQTIANGLNINADFSVTGGNTLTFSGTETVDLGQVNTTINIASDTTLALDTGKDFSGTGGLTVDGGGTLSIASNDTDFSGGLIVESGNVLVSQNDSLILGEDSGGNNYLGTGNITVNSGSTLTATMSGANTIELSGGVTLTNNSGTVTLSNTNGAADFLLGDTSNGGNLVNTGGTTSITVGDNITVESGSSLTVSGGTINLTGGGDFSSPDTGTTGSTYSVTNGGTLNVDLSEGVANSFGLSSNDTFTVDGAFSTVNISGATDTAVSLVGQINLTNNGTLAVSGGVTSLASTTILDGGSELTAGTLQITDGDLSVTNPAVSNRPNITMNVGNGNSNEITSSVPGTGIINLGTITKAGDGDLTLDSNLNNIEGSLLDVQGGTLFLSADDQIGNSTDLELSGGTLNLNDFNEIVDTLTLSADSTIDMGSAAGDGSILQFSDSEGIAWDGSSQLIIENWNGDFEGGGLDQILFADAGLSETQLGQIIFRNPAGQTGDFAAQWRGNEIVPVPEPSTYIGGALLLLGCVYRERKRIRSWFKQS